MGLISRVSSRTYRSPPPPPSKMTTGEVRVGNSILPNLTIAAASADEDTDDVLICQDAEEMETPLTQSKGSQQKIIRPSLVSNHRQNENNVSHLLEKMGGKSFVVMDDFEETVDLNQLEEPSILAIEDVVRWGLKYNQTAFALRKLRSEAIFCVGVNELSTEQILNY